MVGSENLCYKKGLIQNGSSGGTGLPYSTALETPHDAAYEKKCDVFIFTFCFVKKHVLQNSYLLRDDLHCE